MILFLVLVGVRLQVLLSYQSNDMLTSFQVVEAGRAAAQSGNDAVKHSGWDGFWLSIGVFSILAAIYIARLMLDMFLVQRFCLAWREWLTDRLTGDWLDGKAYYRARFIDDKIDNPDQRIQSDIDIFTAGNGPLPNVPYYYSQNTLLFGAVDAVASMISFTAILWNLSGPLAIPIINYQLPRAMFWIGIVFVLIASVIAFWIGRPIIWLSFSNEKFNAAFRYALVRLRDASEAVAFYRGEPAERTGLRKLFAPVVSNYKRYVGRSLGFNGWNWSMSQAIVPLPYLLQFPRFYSGEITARRYDAVGLGVRLDPGRPVVLPQRLRHVRRLPRRDHPARRVSSPPTRKAGRCRRSRPRRVSTARSSSPTSRSAPPTASS